MRSICSIDVLELNLCGIDVLQRPFIFDVGSRAVSAVHGRGRGRIDRIRSHAAPICLDGYLEAYVNQSQFLVGVALDGFLIYSEWDANGEKVYAAQRCRTALRPPSIECQGHRAQGPEGRECV